MTDLSGFYDAIFKRKSFHLFRGVGDERITPEELDAIKAAFSGFARLYPDVRVALRIVPGAKRDAEYGLLLYSEKKENYLLNAGYLGQQLDLWLCAHDIGSVWYGLGKPDEPTFDGLDYVIMLAVHKVTDPQKYRQDMFAAKRKPPAEGWTGEDPGIANVVRFAPSACNSQPWLTVSENGKLTVFRQKPKKFGILTVSAARYFNRIDMGIYLCFLEICLCHAGIAFDRVLFPDAGEDAQTKTAEYSLK